MSKTLKTLSSGIAVKLNDLFLSRQGADTADVAVTGKQIEDFMTVRPALDLQKWRGALGKVISGTADAKVLCIGDSTTYGTLSNFNSSSGDMRTRSYPSLLAKLVSSSGIPTNGQSFFGCGVTSGSAGGALSGQDPRLTVGSGWATNGSDSLGGSRIRGTGTYGQLSFLPTVNVDTFKVWYLRFAGNGTFSLNINGGTATNVNAAGATALLSQTITGTLGSNTLNINYVSAGDVYIVGIEAYDSTSKRVHFVNAGWGTSTSSNWNGVKADIAAFAPDLTIINLGINDELSAMPLATSQTYLQNIISAVTTGSILMMTHTPYNYISSDATKDAFVAMVKALAIANNIPCLDYYSRSGGYTAFNAAGLMGFDSIHPNQNGYADMALAIKNRILG